MAESKLKLNPTLRVSVFDGNNKKEWLYEVTDAQGYDKRFTVTSTVHMLLDNFQEAQSLDTFLSDCEHLDGEQLKAFKSLVLNYLLPNNVLIKDGEFVEASSFAKKRKKPHYMILKFTLLNPRLVKACSAPFSFLFKTHWGVLTVSLFAVSQLLLYVPGLFPFFNEPELGISSASISSGDVLAAVFLTFWGLLFHEIGHAAAAIRFRCKDVDIGAGLYICFIVFYADLSEIWRIKRKQRLLVDVAGMYFQMVFMVVITAVYFFSPHYFLYLANIILGISLLWNLNPFFRLDGYWIASDLFGFDNLRAAAHASTGGRSAASSLMVSHRKQVGKRRVLLSIYSLLSKLAFVGIIYWFSTRVFGDVLNSLPQRVRALAESNSLSDFLVTMGGLIWAALMLTFAGYLLVRVAKMIYSAGSRLRAHDH